MAVADVHVLDVDIRIEYKGELYTPMELIDLLDEKQSRIDELEQECEAYAEQIAELQNWA